MKTLLFVALLSLSASASAEIFKCVTPSGDLAYQGTPCNELSIEQLINLPATSAGVEIITEDEINQVNQRALEEALQEKKDKEALTGLKKVVILKQ